MRGLAFTPTTLARVWRREEALRPAIEADITGANAWGQFRWDRMTGALVGRFTERQRSRMRTADAAISRVGPIVLSDQQRALAGWGL